MLMQASEARLAWLTRMAKADVAWPTLALAIVSVGGFIALGIAAATGAIPLGVSIPLSAIAAFAGFTPLHDASHRAISRARWVNELVGWACGFPVLAPFSGFRYLHYAHHAHTNDPVRDPDMWSGKAKTRAGIALRWTIMDLHYLARYLTEIRTRPRGEVIASVVGVGAMWTSWIVLIATGHGVDLLVGWLIPARLAILMLSIVFDWIPHYPRAFTLAQDPYRATNVYEHRWLGPVLLGQNYHLVHHLYPGVPFYRYGRVFWEMRDELLARGADIRRIGRRIPSTPRPSPGAMRIGAVIDETPDTKTFVFAARAEFRAGQFVVVELPTGARRCYSISRPPESRELAITVKRQGAASAWLHDHVRAGDELRVGPPQGRFVLDAGDRRLIAFAAGSGITPIISIVESALASTSRRVRLVYASRDHVIFRARLDELARAHAGRFELVYAGARGRIDRDEAARHLDVEAELYTCGPAGFMDTVMLAATLLAIPPERRHAERFAPRTLPATPGPRALSFVAIRRGVERLVQLDRDETLLAAARRAGLEPRASCEDGYCGTCAARLTCGRVDARTWGPLGDDDIARGFILPCQAHALASDPVVVDLDAAP
jgi:ferredoxin-NADP reductase/fatty acid desaturase